MTVSRRSRNGARITITCKHCGVDFQVPPCRANLARYCSKKCVGSVVVHTINAVRKPATSNGGWFKRKRVSLTCEWCRGSFERVASRIAEGAARGKKHILCSPNCAKSFRRSQSGERSPYWKGGLAIENTERGVGWRLHRMTVVNQQHGQCAKCGIYVGRSLVIHHVVAFEQFAAADEANALSNLQGLCRPCHSTLHNAMRSRRTHCRQGHEFTSDNLRLTPEGWYRCRLCATEKARRYQRMKRQRAEQAA